MFRILVFSLVISILSIGAISCSDDPSSNNTDDPVLVVPVDLKLDTLLEDLVNPWALDFLPDQSILFTERRGTLTWFKDGVAKDVSGLTEIHVYGQGGLLDVRVDPNFASTNRIFYSASTKVGENFSTALFSANFNDGALSNVQKLFQATPLTQSPHHFGSRIVFDDSGHLYLCLGERNDKPTAQDLMNHNGSVVRLNLDGSIPSDNPFFNDDFARDEIYTYGHRNPQGMSVHPETGDIYVHEHGPKGGDEINILKPGANYGWPLATFGIDYDGSIISEDTFVSGTELPIYYWVPSIAPCGMDFYHGDAIPQWKGDLFLGALAGQHLNRIQLENGKVTNEERLLEGMARFRAVRTGPDGFLYFLTEGPGLLCRFRPE